MIYDSGKMAVLDKLLAQLKLEDHRVLIYSQMTRMIDLLEEFMAYRRYHNSLSLHPTPFGLAMYTIAHVPSTFLVVCM